MTDLAFTITVSSNTSDEEILELVRKKRTRNAEELEETAKKFETLQEKLLERYREDKEATIQVAATRLHQEIIPLIHQHIKVIKEVDLAIQELLSSYTPAEKEYIQENCHYWSDCRESETYIVTVTRRIMTEAITKFAEYNKI